MKNIKRILNNIDLGIDNRKFFDTTQATFQGIIAGEQGHTLAQWLAEKFNHNFDAYDSAIDSIYNQAHIGGSVYHHLIDGQHSIWGAFKAIQDANLDDSWAQSLGHAAEHLIRDTASVSGINPFLTLTPHQFDQIGSLVSHIGITKEYLADALTVNGPELLGGSIALVSAIILGKRAEFDRLSYISGGCLISSLVSANPMLMPIAAGSMV
jgi:hypothetical protein